MLKHFPCKNREATQADMTANNPLHSQTVSTQVDQDCQASATQEVSLSGLSTNEIGLGEVRSMPVSGNIMSRRVAGYVSGLRALYNLESQAGGPGCLLRAYLVARSQDSGVVRGREHVLMLASSQIKRRW